jgi:SAM-dependent methyltransferase
MGRSVAATYGNACESLNGPAHARGGVVPSTRLAFDDAAFDEQLPVSLQVKSSTHFTPVEVARHAARLLAPSPGMTVLDVGAGAGKFCLAAAFAAPCARFVGVERRPHLVEIATRLARAWGIANAWFIRGDALDLDWSQYDAFYFYNPFAEQLFEHAFVLDHTIDFDPANFILYVTAVRQRLALARPGTRLVTYHGYGAPPPLGYEREREDAIGPDRVELWVKTRSISCDQLREDAA